MFPRTASFENSNKPRVEDYVKKILRILCEISTDINIEILRIFIFSDIISLLLLPPAGLPHPHRSCGLLFAQEVHRREQRKGRPLPSG